MALIDDLIATGLAPLQAQVLVDGFLQQENAAETIAGDKTFSGAVDLTGSLKIGGVTVSASAVELNYNDVTAAGTGQASKAAILDASGNFAFPDGGYLKPSAAVVAAAGTTAADATVLADEENVVTGGDGAKGVALPAAATGLRIHIVNTAAREIKVYPVNGGNDNINALAEDAAFTLGPNRDAWFLATSATQWYVNPNADGSETIIVPIAGNAKVGATAGWVITAGTNIDHATLPASQTDATLVVGIPGLNVGDIVTAFAVCGQVESAGNNVTLVASLRKLTNAAADNTDAEIATDNVGTLTADTILSAANLGGSLGTAEVVAADEKIYLLLTGTTGGSTDIDVSHATVTVTRAK